jgi:hypothetical protein
VTGAVVAVAAISLQHRAAEASLRVAMPEVAIRGVPIMLEADTPGGHMPGAAMLGLEWDRMALDRMA